VSELEDEEECKNSINFLYIFNITGNTYTGYYDSCPKIVEIVLLFLLRYSSILGFHITRNMVFANLTYLDYFTKYMVHTLTKLE
jgi:hypothetical protein